MVPARHLALALALLAAVPANAGVLFKSIAADGSVMFSDVPPPSDARLLETRIVGDNGPAQRPRDPNMVMVEAERLLVSDEAVARANARLDQAEHELALARRDTWSPRDGLRMAPTRLTLADQQRIRVYRNAAFIARQALMDLLRDRRVAVVASPAALPSPSLVSLVSRP